MEDGDAGARLSIVVVDDAADVRSLVRTRLRLSGHFDVVADGGTGLEAVALSAQHLPDVVLLDVSMPRMDGLEALPRIMTVSPGSRVVMYSGFDERGLATRALALGAVGFLEKSVPIDELADRVRQLAADVDAPVPGGAAADARPGVGRAAVTVDDADERADSVLSQHLERFREVFEDAAIGMATMTLAGHLVRANRALARLLGRDIEELTGASYVDIAGDLHPDQFVATLDELTAAPTSIVQLEHRIDVDGVSIVACSTLAPVVDADGHALYLFLQMQDVTAQRAAEEKLRQSEERFRLLVEAVQDYAIFMLDPDGHVASWNAGAQRSKGYTAAEIIGQHFRTFYPPEMQQAKHPEWELDMAVRDGRYEEEGWRIRKDGTRFWANVVITAVRNGNGDLIGFTKVTRDMTERRAMLERLESANARLQQTAAEQAQFLAMTAHELRTPIRVVAGCAETLARHWPDMSDEERRDMRDAMTVSAARLRRMLDDLLMASRLEAGAVEMHLASVPLAGVLTDTAASLRTTNPDAEVIVECSPDVVVIADADRLSQIVDNLLANALRHGRSPVQISVEVDGRTVYVQFADAGEGVPVDVRGRLFERFSTGESHGGTGLGLFIVRELARAQGGDARYEEAPDGTMRFVVSLRRAAVAGRPASSD
ncbi:MAG TPA: PAS domain S-box protein [Mycobacteriales bacterium]|nr:PAS domain S-box protein [Mycobacteriales bacterium]